MSERDRYWAIDPGETMGRVSLGIRDNYPVIWHASDTKTVHLELGVFCRAFIRMMRDGKPTVVVIEDYRIYPDKAREHIGSRLYTVRQIATIQTLCCIAIPPIPTVLIPAAKKKRFPIKRLKTMFPEYIQVKYGSHARDALLLGLAYLEKEKIWVPEVPDVS